MKSAQSVIVTGAEGALGSRVAERFLRAGCRVWATCHRDPRELTVPAGASLEWIRCDLTDAADVRGKLGQLAPDALVHCAGGFRFAKLDQLGDADLDFLIDGNLRSAFLLVRELLPGMKARDFGRIIFVSARATLAPGAGMGAYAASKAGLNALTSSLADETRAFDINVNAVLPTIIDTAANRADMPKADFGAWVAPEALAEILFSLTQAWGQPIHGALIPVGGRL